MTPRVDRTADSILRFAARHTGIDVASCAMDDNGVLCGDSRLTLTDLLAAARARGIRFTESRKAYGSPRSVSTNAHGFRIAVHRVTGEIRILYSVQATDAGVSSIPCRCVARSRAASHRASASPSPRTSTSTTTASWSIPSLRNYRIPTFADIPRTEIIFVESHDSLGPMASKGIAECCINPVAPALANALADATGVRFRDLPLTPERIYRQLGVK